MIGGAALALARSPEQRRWLAEDAARLPVAVEEFVRWVTPNAFTRGLASLPLEFTPSR